MRSLHDRNCGHSAQLFLIRISHKFDASRRWHIFLLGSIYLYVIGVILHTVESDLFRQLGELLVGGFKHFLFSIIYGIILPIDFQYFQ